MDKWKSTVLTLDPKIIEPILGNYPTTYLNDYLKDPTSKNNQFMLAHEMFTGITDLKTGKMKDAIQAIASLGATSAGGYVCVADSVNGLFLTGDITACSAIAISA